MIVESNASGDDCVFLKIPTISFDDLLSSHRLLELEDAKTVNENELVVVHNTTCLNKEIILPPPHPPRPHLIIPDSGPNPKL
jgi:hypothetical protein